MTRNDILMSLVSAEFGTYNSDWLMNSTPEERRMVFEASAKIMCEFADAILKEAKGDE